MISHSLILPTILYVDSIFFSFFFYGQRICIHQNVLINPVFVQQSVSHKREVNHTRLIMCGELNLENVGKTIQTRAYNIELFLFHQLDCLNQIILIRSYQLNSKWLIRCFVDKIHMYLNLLQKKKKKLKSKPKHYSIHCFLFVTFDKLSCSRLYIYHFNIP